MKRIEKTGMRFGKILVLRYVGDQRWECRCDCGNIFNVVASNLSTKNTRKGTTMCRECFVNNFMRAGLLRRTHGMKGSRFYKIWCVMRQRCNNPKYSYSYDYGGRGIKVCDQWNNSFEEFKKDMYEPYLQHVKEFGEKNTSIERVDNNAGYSPSNCIWATRAVQRRNTRNNHYITFNGQTKIISDWATELGLSKGYSILRRLRKGWSLEKALSTTKSKKNDSTQKNHS